MAPWPGGGTPPSADLTVPIVQVRPSSPDTKNCARATRPPDCDPTATISSPTLVIRPSVWVMPRTLAGAVKSWPARVAGGKPREAADGAGPAWPLFASAITTTATPKTTMARIGIATLIPQPRNSRPARKSRDQRCLTGSGSSERSKLAHSAPALSLSGGRPPGTPPVTGGCPPPVPPGTPPVTGGCPPPVPPGEGLPAPPSRPRAGGRNGNGTAAPGWGISPNSKPGEAIVSSPGHAGGAESGWLTVGVYRNRRGPAAPSRGAAGGGGARTRTRAPSRSTDRRPA